MMDEDHEVNKKVVHLKIFSTHILQILESMPEDIGSVLMTVQPMIGHLTYLLHPLFFGIISLFNKRRYEIKDLKLAKQGGDPLDWSDVHLPHKHFETVKDHPRADEERFPRVAFINLDGYESEFNL